MSLGTCRLVMPLRSSTIARRGPLSMPSRTARSIAARSSAGSFCADLSRLPRPSFGADAGGGQRVAVLLEELGEEGLHRVAEDDRVGDLHHRGLEVHARTAGPRPWRAAICCGEELVQRRRRSSRCRRRPRPPAPAPTRAARWSCRRRATSSMRSESSAGMTADFSVDRKSPAVMSRRWSWSSGVQAPIECGCCARVLLDRGRARGGRSCPRAAPG